MAISEEYQAMMQKRHRYSDTWGKSVVRYGAQDIVGLIDTYDGQIRTILDYGCGKGDLLKHLNEVYGMGHVSVTEYDPGIPGKDVLPEGKFDLVVTCDVLEHVEPHMLADTLQEIERLTGNWSYHNIACSPTGGHFEGGIYDGLPTHISLHHPSKWRLKFLTYTNLELFEWRHIIRTSPNGLRTRCTLILENTNG